MDEQGHRIALPFFFFLTNFPSFDSILQALAIKETSQKCKHKQDVIERKDKQVRSCIEFEIFMLIYPNFCVQVWIMREFLVFELSEIFLVLFLVLICEET